APEDRKSYRRIDPSTMSFLSNDRSRPLAETAANVRFGSKADTCGALANVRFSPKSGQPEWVDLGLALADFQKQTKPQPLKCNFGGSCLRLAVKRMGTANSWISS